MATVEEIQAELDPQELNTRIRIIKKFTVGTADTFYCLGGVDIPGRARWCETDNTDTAATQATAITDAMA